MVPFDGAVRKGSRVSLNPLSQAEACATSASYAATPGARASAVARQFEPGRASPPVKITAIVMTIEPLAMLDHRTMLPPAAHPDVVGSGARWNICRRDITAYHRSGRTESDAHRRSEEH